MDQALPPLTEVEQKVLELRLNHPEMKTADIAKVINYGISHTTHMITNIRKKGYHVPAPPRTNCRVPLKSFRVSGRVGKYYHAVICYDLPSALKRANELKMHIENVENISEDA